MTEVGTLVDIEESLNLVILYENYEGITLKSMLSSDVNLNMK